MVKVIDNFLPKTYFREIQNILLSNNFPWNYNDNISFKNGDPTNQYGFSHTIFEAASEIYKSNYCDFFLPFIYTFMDSTLKNPSNENILRCRTDMVTNKNIDLTHDTHVDFDFPHFSSVFYINDSDGNTIIYDKKHPSDIKNLKIKKEVTPKANRIVIFDGLYWHTGKSPSKHNNRVIINTNIREI